MSPILKWIGCGAVISAFSACTLNPNILIPETCNIRAYTETSLLEYLESEQYAQKRSRFAIIPFDVPETFAAQGGQNRHFGRELARMFHQELQSAGELPIIELYDIDRWPGKRQEFFAGNYRAIEIGRHAGFDFVLLGYLDDITNATDLSLYTKIVDTSNGITVWSGHSEVRSHLRDWKRELSRTRLLKEQPEEFRFKERVAELARCTTKRILSDGLELDEAEQQ